MQVIAKHPLVTNPQRGLSTLSIPIQKIYENSETHGFIKDFAVWDFKNPYKSSPSPLAAYSPDRAGGVSPDASVNGNMGAPRRFSTHGLSLDDLLVSPDQEIASIPEGGELQMWRVENFKLVPVTEKKIGQFYSSDCYVIQYQIKGADGKKEVMIYFWLGSHSTSDDKAAAAVQAKDLDEKLGHTATQVKVVEGREPIHFRTLFKGLLVIHRRGKVSGYKEKSANWRSSIQCTALYQVHGSQALATYATQVQVMASSLNSADCFVLVAPTSVFLWLGNSTSKPERTAAEEIANVFVAHHWMYVTLEIIVEGEETYDFWEQIGGQMEYAHDRDPIDYRTQYSEARLFHCTSLTGESLRVEEVEPPPLFNASSLYL